ncbi:CoA transferase [bacterium]|nr:CoA transferase [bacterium]
MERSAIDRAARLAGLELSPDTDIAVTGADPVIPAPFHLGEGAATALALVGQEANALWEMRGGRKQTLTLDVRHAAASLVSYTQLKVPELRAPARTPSAITAIYKCADDRYIHLHGSFEQGRGIYAELGLEFGADAEAVTDATAKRGAFELEDALAVQGRCAAVVRSPEEWNRGPQAAWLLSRPVVEVTRIGDAPPEPLHDGPRPLSGVRVVDATRVLAGPTCARTLAEHGADVVHIASPNLPTMDLFEIDTGHGKRQAWCDLNDAAQAAQLRGLLLEADVFSQGFRLGKLAGRGLGPEQLAELRPGIIYVSENCYGQVGPWAQRPGWEQLAQTVSGVAHTMAQDGGKPRLSGAAMNDYTTGYFSALGTMIALRRRAVEGGSWLVRTSLTQTSMWYIRLGTGLDRSAGQGLGDTAAFMEDVAATGEATYGPYTRLRPALQMSETPPHWATPSVPLGSGTMEWLPR